MYTITDEYKEKLLSEGTIKKGYLRLVPQSNEDKEVIFDEKAIKYFTIRDTIYTKGYGVLGGVVAKQIIINLFNEAKQDLTDREIEAYVGVEGENDYIYLGRFIIQKPENETETSKTYFEGLDYMVKFNKLYTDKNVTYPIQLKDLLQQICKDCDVTLNTTEGFVNDEWLIENNQFAKGETYREALSRILEIAGSYCKINGKSNELYIYNIKDGLSYLKGESLKVSDTLTNHDYTTNLQINNKFGGVNRLVINMSQVTGEEVIREDTDLIQKDGVQEIKITDNPLLYTQQKRTEVIDNLFNAIKEFEYVDFKCKILTARPYLETGDKISIETTAGETITTYLFTHDLTFNGSLTSEMSASADTGTEKEYAYIPPVSTRIRNTELSVDQANAQIKAIISEGGENFNSLTQITANLDGVEQKVTSFTNFTAETSGKNRIILDDALPTSILSFELDAENIEKPGIYPSTTLYPSATLYPRKAGDYFTIVVSNDNEETTYKEYAINIPITLREYNGVHDKVIVEFNQEAGTCTVKTYKYVTKSGNVYTIRENPIVTTVYEDFDFTLYKGTNYIRVKEYTTWNMKVTYLTNNELNKYYATKVETATSIKETKDTITLQTEKQIGEETTGEKLISKINLAPESATIQAKNISLEGYTTINKGFSIDEDGNAKIANGAVNIDKNGIQMADGTSIVGGKGLMTMIQYVGRGNISVNATLGSFYPVGFWGNSFSQSNFRIQNIIDAYIPTNFTIDSAYLVLKHFPISAYNGSNLIAIGHSTKIKLYQSSTTYRNLNWYVGSEYNIDDNTFATEITNSGFGDDGWTPSNYLTHEVETFTSKDISSSLKKGMNKLILQSSDDVPAYSTDYVTEVANYIAKTGMVYAQLLVFGYMSKNE